MDGSLSAALTSSSDGDATSSCALSAAICCLLYTPATRLRFHSTNTNTTQLCLPFSSLFLFNQYPETIKCGWSIRIIIIFFLSFLKGGGWCCCSAAKTKKRAKKLCRMKHLWVKLQQPFANDVVLKQTLSVSLCVSFQQPQTKANAAHLQLTDACS